MSDVLIRLQQITAIFNYENIKGFLAVMGIISTFLGGMSSCHWQAEAIAKDSQVANVAQFYLDELIKCRNEKSKPWL